MSDKIVAMIPARMGSQRLKQKNLQSLAGKPLILHAIEKCRRVELFDEVWVNSEHVRFGEIAREAGVKFHKRPDKLADNSATSEDFVYEFLTQRPCRWVVQVHSIAPLLGEDEILRFVERLRQDDVDVLLSVIDEYIECVYQGQPVNFSLREKTNSQLLEPVRRITWSITAWRASTFLHAKSRGECATYSGRVDYFPISRAGGHIIKTSYDLKLAEAMLGAQSEVEVAS